MRRIIVFGATSAIAAEVCARWAARGDRLHLVGRDLDRLAGVVARCAGAEVSTGCGDFVDLARAESLAAEGVAALGGAVDVVLVAHGDLGDQARSEHDVAEAARVVQVNFLSVLAVVVPLANVLERQRGGTIAVITSVAGERGRPRNYTYGAAKGALHVYLQGLRSRLHAAGVTVTTLKLGPVDTPMTAGHAKNRLFATPQRVAIDIDRAIERRRAVAFVPWYWRPILFVVRHTPEPIFQRLRFLSGR